VMPSIFGMLTSVITRSNFPRSAFSSASQPSAACSTWWPAPVSLSWLLATAAAGGDVQASRQLDAILALLVHSCRELAGQLEPFLPDASARIAAQVTPARLPAPQPVFARIDPAVVKAAAT